MSFLEFMMEVSKLEAQARKSSLPFKKLERLIGERKAPPSFGDAISRKGGALKVIAELKKASPSAGRISGEVDAYSLVRAYREAGAAAASVITCTRYFEGSVEDLKEAARVEGFPILRKDFISDPYQVLEARAFGASSVLLIADALLERELENLIDVAQDAELEPLVEAHSREALIKALSAGAKMIGINNRNLKSLEVDLSTTEELIGFVPDGCTVVSESGIKTPQDVRRMDMLGVDALLIGEMFMRSKNPAKALLDLISACGLISHAAGSSGQTDDSGVVP